MECFLTLTLDDVFADGLFLPDYRITFDDSLCTMCLRSASGLIGSLTSEFLLLVASCETLFRILIGGNYVLDRSLVSPLMLGLRPSCD